MKMYTKPSLEVKKFDVEDIIQTSGMGTFGGKENLTTAGAALYEEAVGTDVAENIIEFEW